MDGDPNLASGFSYVSERGEITIPSEVIRHMKLKPGDEVDFQISESGKLLMIKANPAHPDRFERALGAAGPGLTTDEVMILTRGVD